MLYDNQHGGAMTIAQRARNAVAFLRSYGARRFFHYVLLGFSEMWHERYFGIDTGGTVGLETLGIVNADAVEYRPTPYQGFMAAMRRIPIGRSDEDVFIDYGAGKGRIVTVAATLRLRRVVGIELSPQLAAKARENLGNAKGRFRCKSVDILTCDATAFAVPDDATILHFYNPFRGETLRRVIANIRESLNKTPRQLVLMFANPWYIDALLRSGEAFPSDWLRGEDDVLWPHYDHGQPNANRYRIYRLDSRGIADSL